MGRIALVMTFVVLAGRAGAVDTTFSDGEFAFAGGTLASWTFVEIDSPAGFDAGSVTVAPVSDGSPGSALRIGLSMFPAPAFSQITGVWLWSVPYDPATSGAIGSLDYEESARYVSGSGQGHATGPALRQNGSIFIHRIGFTPERDWTPKPATGITPADFQRLQGSGTLDFSAAGAPIEVGFYRATSHPSTGGGAGTRAVDIDNWRVTLVPPCTTDADCADVDGCTTDTCDAGICRRTPLACDDGDPCTTDACTAGACTSAPRDCDDGNACTADTCRSGACANVPSADFDVVEAKVDEYLAVLLSGAACGDEPLVKQLRPKILSKIRRARARLRRADAATRATLVGRLVSQADTLIGKAQSLLGSPLAQRFLSAPCIAALQGLAGDVRLCVSGLPR